MPTEYTIYRVKAITEASPSGDTEPDLLTNTLVPLGVGVGSYPAAAARQFFAQEGNAKLGNGDLAIIPTRSIHRLAGKTETQTRLVFK